MSRRHCKLGHNRLIPHSSQFTVRHSPTLTANHTTDRCITLWMVANTKPNLHTPASIAGCSKLPIQHIRSYKTNVEEGSCIRSMKIRHAVVPSKPLNMINTSKRKKTTNITLSSCILTNDIYLAINFDVFTFALHAVLAIILHSLSRVANHFHLPAACGCSEVSASRSASRQQIYAAKEILRFLIAMRAVWIHSIHMPEHKQQTLIRHNN